MKEPRSNAGLSDFTLNQKANTLNHKWHPIWCGQVSAAVLEIRVVLANTMQKQKGFHYLSRQEQTPKGLGIKVNCLDFINCLFSSTCHMRLCCPPCADKPYPTWNRNFSQAKTKKKTVTPHKLAALKSVAKAVVLIGLTAVQWGAEGPQPLYFASCVCPPGKMGGGLTQS